MTANFCISGYYTENILFAVLKNEWGENLMKLILIHPSWNLENHLQFTNGSKIKGMGVIWALESM